MSRHPSKAVQDSRDRSAASSRSSHGAHCQCVGCKGTGHESYGRDRAR